MNVLLHIQLFVLVGHGHTLSILDQFNSGQIVHPVVSYLERKVHP